MWVLLQCLDGAHVVRIIKCYSSSNHLRGFLLTTIQKVLECCPTIGMVVVVWQTMGSAVDIIKRSVAQIHRWPLLFKTKAKWIDIEIRINTILAMHHLKDLRCPLPIFITEQNLKIDNANPSISGFFYSVCFHGYLNCHILYWPSITIWKEQATGSCVIKRSLLCLCLFLFWCAQFGKAQDRH